MTDIQASVKHMLQDLDKGFVPSEDILALVAEMAEVEADMDWWLEEMMEGRIYDSCVWYATTFIRAGKPLPAPYDQFVLGVLTGKITRSQRGAKRTPLNIERDITVSAAVLYVIRETGKRGTRNDVSEPHSACDVVVSCLNDLGYKETYKNVERIWMDSPIRKLFRESTNHPRPRELP